ncbi:hypothetical protein ANCDUO_10647 [Ancylostoma duodenale]|uniref:Uncharacterized protein n=1 Tax=Ancylostoma duodenale TaxID=51022 RepID=A0A0C2GJT2_9BILA|nr:hypothetical protein ANCDUO_10647 [Ancylostoma duodenale]
MVFPFSVRLVGSLFGGSGVIALCVCVFLVVRLSRELVGCWGWWWVIGFLREPPPPPPAPTDQPSERVSGVENPVRSPATATAAAAADLT